MHLDIVQYPVIRDRCFVVGDEIEGMDLPLFVLRYIYDIPHELLPMLIQMTIDLEGGFACLGEANRELVSLLIERFDTLKDMGKIINVN
mgnify:FL=1